MTLIAGRNDVGKSALLRGLRVLAETSSEGARREFEITFRWSVPTVFLVEANPGVTAQGHPNWLLGPESQIVATTFRLIQPPEETRGAINPSLLRCMRLELVELGLIAEVPDGGEPTDIRWTGGPYSGSDAFISGFINLIESACREIAYLAPRRIQPGPRAMIATRLLTPTGENLLEVIFHMQTNEPMTRYRALQDFISEAFPQIATVTARTPEGQPGAELHVIYKGAPDRLVPLSQCGTGIEQMLALGAAVLTNPSPRLFLIDEPQAYLHPHAERSFDRFLQEHRQHQYAIATHSTFLLSTNPLSRTRLLTVRDGETVAVRPTAEITVLEEIGLTPADLWLTERILWVEGPSEVEILQTLIATSDDPRVRGILTRPLPTASRFSARGGRGAQQVFEFLRNIATAISPLPLTMLFVFDRDEKSEEVRSKISAASGGRARFLPVREVENLLLHPPSIFELVALRCGDLGLDVPAMADVEAAFEEEIGRTSDRKLFPQGVVDGDAEGSVVGSEVLDRIHRRFLTTEYRKVQDGTELVRFVQRDAPEKLTPLQTLLEELANAE